MHPGHIPIKILHIVPTFHPAVYFGGPIHSLLGLCNALARMKDVQLRVLTTDSNGPGLRDRMDSAANPVRRPEGYDVYYCRKWWGREFSGGLLFRLYPMIRWAEVVHLTSAYSFSTIPALLFCLLMRKPVVWSPRGALQRWEGSSRPLLKRLWETACNALLSPARCILHVTSSQEADESRLRISRTRIEVVNNGVDIPREPERRSRVTAGALRLLFIGRLHPKKGIENLLDAMNRLDHDITLTICGTGDAEYQDALQKRAEELGLTGRVRFAGQVDGEAKSRAFREADVCVVPSFTENFAMVIAEALAHGVPVIASRGTPWRAVVRRGCGLWVENDPDSLAKAVKDMCGFDLEQMGRRGRQWMQESFSWEAAAARMHDVYSKLGCVDAQRVGQ